MLGWLCVGVFGEIPRVPWQELEGICRFELKANNKDGQAFSSRVFVKGSGRASGPQRFWGLSCQVSQVFVRVVQWPGCGWEPLLEHQKLSVGI